MDCIEGFYEIDIETKGDFIFNTVGLLFCKYELSCQIVGAFAVHTKGVFQKPYCRNRFYRYFDKIGRLSRKEKELALSFYAVYFRHLRRSR